MRCEADCEARVETPHCHILISGWWSPKSCYSCEVKAGKHGCVVRSGNKRGGWIGYWCKGVNGGCEIFVFVYIWWRQHGSSDHPSVSQFVCWSVHQSFFIHVSIHLYWITPSWLTISPSVLLSLPFFLTFHPNKPLSFCPSALMSPTDFFLPFSPNFPPTFLW